jgi:hypothetical protein
MTVQIGIDGLRSIAARSGLFEGFVGPFWCGPDGKWEDVWLESLPPEAAKVGVLRAKCREPIWGVARYSEYCALDQNGNPAGLWRRMPATMAAKTAEAQALRRAFPQELSGLYTPDEMAQADRADDAMPLISVTSAPPAHPNPQPEAPAKPWRSFRSMLDEFGKLHGRLRPEHDQIYRETLEQFGVAHSNQFKDSGQAVACYNRLVERVLQVEAAAHDADAELPAEDFDQRQQEPEATA